jgi:hypothetical protein
VIPRDWSYVPCQHGGALIRFGALPNAQQLQIIDLNAAHLVFAAPVMASALRAMVEEFGVYVDGKGQDCDHDVGICVCSERTAMHAAREALKMAGVL